MPFDVSAFIFHWMRLLQPSVLHSLSTKNISPVHKVIPDRLRIFIKRFLMLDFSCSGFLLEIVGWSEGTRSAQQFNFNTPVYNLRICNHSAKGHKFYIYKKKHWGDNFVVYNKLPYKIIEVHRNFNHNIFSPITKRLIHF